MSTRVRLRNPANFESVEHKSDDELLLPEYPPSSTDQNGCSGKKSFLSKVLILALVGAVILLVVLFVIIPFTFRWSTALQSSIVFMNFINLNILSNLSKPYQDYRMNCTRSIYLQSNDSLRLGVWHVLPELTKLSANNDCSAEKLNSLTDKAAFADGKNVVLYVHGNGGTRGSKHRMDLYDVFSNNFDMHVVAFDYRGFGDSANIRPSAEGLTNDTIFVYNWLIESGVSTDRILLWGHSLGTAVSIRFLSAISGNTSNPPPTVLEAPFTSFTDAIIEYPLSKIFRFLPYFEYCFIDPLVNNPATNFDSVSLLPTVYAPLLILHAEDDNIIPFYLGKRLYELALKNQPKTVANAQFHAFPAKLGYKHKYIYSDPNLHKIVKDCFEQF